LLRHLLIADVAHRATKVAGVDELHLDDLWGTFFIERDGAKKRIAAFKEANQFFWLLSPRQITQPLEIVRRDGSKPLGYCAKAFADLKNVVAAVGANQLENHRAATNAGEEG
jgi:hypothetical protein